MPDSRKLLHVLDDEWGKCQKCALGKDRVARKKQPVNGNYRGAQSGNGLLRPVMFIVDAPRRSDEQDRKLITWSAGQLFDSWLTTYSIPRVYVTSAVLCRSCAPYIDRTTGVQKLDERTGAPVFVDIPPTPEHTYACRPRLLEEIYIVDPLLIVPLGNYAMQILTGGTVQKIENEHGRLRELGFPGNGIVPQRTPKGKWGRKVRGTWVWPTERREVLYPVLPLMSPEHILKQAGDIEEGGKARYNEALLNKATADIRLLANLYNQLAST